jgi:hypothetical protein
MLNDHRARRRVILSLVNEWRIVMEVVIGAASASFGWLNSSTVLAGAAVLKKENSHDTHADSLAYASSAFA